MFSSIKKLFSRRTEEVSDQPSHQIAPAAAAPYASRASATAPRPAGVRTELPPRQVVVPANAPASLAIPLKSIVDRLPADLQQRVRQHPAGDAHISVSMQKILSQIPQGAVKLTFGELRLASPPGTFSVEIDRDRNLVEVPLQEVLGRLDPSLLARRPMQRQVVVPPEVTGPFGGQAKVIFSATPLKGATPAQPVPNGNGNGYANGANGSNGHTKSFSKTQVAQTTPPPAPMAAPAVTAAPAPIGFKPVQKVQPAIARAPQSQPISSLAPSPIAALATARTTTPFTPSPVPQPAPVLKSAQPIVARIVQPTPTPSRAMPVAVPVISPMAPAVEPLTFNRVSPAPVAPSQPVYSPIAPAAELPEPATIAMPEMPAIQMPPISPIAIAPESEPEPIRFQMPEPEPVAPVVPVETRFLHTTLGVLSTAWPEEIYDEIKTLQITGATVALPFGVIEASLKQGKIALPWRIIRSWVQSPEVQAASPQEATILELPLKVITPLFMSELRGAAPRKKISIDQSIPDLFSNRQTEPAPAAPAPIAPAPRPVAAPAPRTVAKAAALPPPPRPADTNYFAKLTPENQPEEAAPVVKQGPTPGTAFLVRYATPNEIVAKAADLPGVDGALIALPDGLLVASRIPATMNADTIAAFLPQIFGRVSQCTKELRLGELNNLNFTVGNIPWKIFKVGAIYFAAFGRVGEPLPSANLAAIAAELDRKAK